MRGADSEADFMEKCVEGLELLFGNVMLLPF